MYGLIYIVLFAYAIAILVCYIPWYFSKLWVDQKIPWMPFCLSIISLLIAMFIINIVDFSNLFIGVPSLLLPTLVSLSISLIAIAVYHLLTGFGKVEDIDSDI